MESFKSHLRAFLKAACANPLFNFIIGIIWFMSFVGGSAYLFFFNGDDSTSGLFGALNLVLCIFLFLKSYAGKPDGAE